jgi:hypothetical protein
VRLIGRVFVILFAVLCGSFAGGLLVAIALLLPEVGALSLHPAEQGMLAVFATFGFVFLSAHALVPALLVIIAAEAFSVRSVLFYAVAGGLLGAVLLLGADSLNMRELSADTSARRELEIMAAAGIVAGFVYWAIAGRKAGMWRERRP